MVPGLQVMNTAPGGGLPGQNGALPQINANNTVVRPGSGNEDSARTFGYLFADADYTWSFDGDETSWNGKVGMRWQS